MPFLNLKGSKCLIILGRSDYASQRLVSILKKIQVILKYRTIINVLNATSNGAFDPLAIITKKNRLICLKRYEYWDKYRYEYLQTSCWKPEKLWSCYWSTERVFSVGRWQHLPDPGMVLWRGSLPLYSQPQDFTWDCGQAVSAADWWVIHPGVTEPRKFYYCLKTTTLKHSCIACPFFSSNINMFLFTKVKNIFLTSPPQFLLGS